MNMSDYSINSTVLNKLLAIGKANVTIDFYRSYYYPQNATQVNISS